MGSYFGKVEGLLGSYLGTVGLGSYAGGFVAGLGVVLGSILGVVFGVVLGAVFGAVAGANACVSSLVNVPTRLDDLAPTCSVTLGAVRAAPPPPTGVFGVGFGILVRVTSATGFPDPFPKGPVALPFGVISLRADSPPSLPTVFAAACSPSFLASALTTALPACFAATMAPRPTTDPPPVNGARPTAPIVEPSSKAPSPIDFAALPN